MNPYTSGDLDLQVTQNLLQGFGSAVNGRNIRVQKNNLKVTDLQFKQQVITTVSAVLTCTGIWSASTKTCGAPAGSGHRRSSCSKTTRSQVALGALAEIEITRAEAQLYTSQQDLVISQTNLLQQETVLKNALSRNGVASPTLADVHIIPLDKLVDSRTRNELKPLNDLIWRSAATNAWKSSRPASTSKATS